MSDIDPRILHILKVVAIEKPHYDDMSVWCGFCDGDEVSIHKKVKFDQIAHKPGCTTLLARSVLSEKGMSLFGYQVSYKHPRWKTKKVVSNWFSVTHFIEAFNEDDLRKEYPEGDGEPVFDVVYYRNVTIEKIEELS